MDSIEIYLPSTNESNAYASGELSENRRPMAMISRHCEKLSAEDQADMIRLFTL